MWRCAARLIGAWTTVLLSVVPARAEPPTEINELLGSWKGTVTGLNEDPYGPRRALQVSITGDVVGCLWGHPIGGPHMVLCTFNPKKRQLTLDDGPDRRVVLALLRFNADRQYRLQGTLRVEGRGTGYRLSMLRGTHIIDPISNVDGDPALRAVLERYAQCPQWSGHWIEDAAHLLTSSEDHRIALRVTADHEVFARKPSGPEWTRMPLLDSARRDSVTVLDPATEHAWILWVKDRVIEGDVLEGSRRIAGIRLLCLPSTERKQ